MRDYDAIRNVLIITFVLNMLASVAKLVVGLATGALSLLADGLDTLFDGISNIVGIIAVRISRRPPDAEHPYGHRKFETIAALFIAAALFVTTWEVATGAVARLLNPRPVVVNAWSIGALIFGAALQTGTGLWERHKARQLRSEVLMADARHTLASVGVSMAVLLGLGLVWLGYPWADPLFALVVAAFIAKIGIDTVSENVPALVDRAPLNEAEIGAVVSGVTGVESFHRIRSRGPMDSVAIDLHIRVDKSLSMQDANAIADEVRRRLLDLPGVADVTVHAEAERGSESTDDVYTATKLVAQELGVVLHECWVQTGESGLRLHLHVGVDPALTLGAAHDVVSAMESTIRERQPQVENVHTHIELANVEVLPTARVSRHLSGRVEGAVHAAADEIPQLREPHEIQVHQVEGRLFITVEALVDGEMSVADAHDLSTLLQDAVRARINNVGEVLVHLEPDDGAMNDGAAVDGATVDTPLERPAGAA